MPVDLVSAPLHGPPQGDGDREHEVIVLACACLIRCPTSAREMALEILQFLDQSVSLDEFGGEAQLA